MKAPNSPEYFATRDLMRQLKLNTVCEEAACPEYRRVLEAEARHGNDPRRHLHPRLRILQCEDRDAARGPSDPLEPQHTADAAAELGLEHIVITSVDRDDLPDGGASQFVDIFKVIQALRRTTPKTTIEILTPDFRNKAQAAVQVDRRGASPMSTIIISKPCPGSIPNDPPRRALFLCVAAPTRVESNGMIRRSSPNRA